MDGVRTLQANPDYPIHRWENHQVWQIIKDELKRRGNAPDGDSCFVIIKVKSHATEEEKRAGQLNGRGGRV